MTIYRIFVSDMGKFDNHKHYEFVADFADRKVAKHYVTYMRGKKRYAKKDIIVKLVSLGEIDASAGTVDGVVTVLGENLPVDEYDFI